MRWLKLRVLVTMKQFDVFKSSELARSGFHRIGNGCRFMSRHTMCCWWQILRPAEPTVYVTGVNHNSRSMVLVQPAGPIEDVGWNIVGGQEMLRADFALILCPPIGAERGGQTCKVHRTGQRDNMLA